MGFVWLATKGWGLGGWCVCQLHVHKNRIGGGGLGVVGVCVGRDELVFNYKTRSNAITGYAAALTSTLLGG